VNYRFSYPQAAAVAVVMLAALVIFNAARVRLVEARAGDNDPAP
jgi:hypothetical protein